MSRLITSVHEFPSCYVKVYASKEVHDTENAVATAIVDSNNGVLRFGVAESYNGVKGIEAFEEALNLFSLEDDFWYDSETIDYAIVEIIDEHTDFYNMGDCETFIRYDNKWFDIYDLILNQQVMLPPQHDSSVLGVPKEIGLPHVSEIILATSSCGVTVEDLNDRITEDRDFMNNISFDDTSDVRLVHVKFV